MNNLIRKTADLARKVDGLNKQLSGLMFLYASSVTNEDRDKCTELREKIHSTIDLLLDSQHESLYLTKEILKKG